MHGYSFVSLEGLGASCALATLFRRWEGKKEGDVRLVRRAASAVLIPLVLPPLSFLSSFPLFPSFLSNLKLRFSAPYQ